MLVVHMLWFLALARLWLRVPAGVFVVLAGAATRTAGSSLAQAGAGWLALPASVPKPTLSLSVLTRRLRWTLKHALLAAKLWRAQKPLMILRLPEFWTSRSLLLPPCHYVSMILMNRTLKLKKIIFTIIRTKTAKVMRSCHVKRWWVGRSHMHALA